MSSPAICLAVKFIKRSSMVHDFIYLSFYTLSSDVNDCNLFLIFFIFFIFIIIIYFFIVNTPESFVRYAVSK